MLIQAAGLALLAALSPTALLVAAVYLGSARPRYVTAFYLAGFETPSTAAIDGFFRSLDRDPRKRFLQALFLAGCAVNGLRNAQGTGHGRPFPATVTDAESKAAIQLMGLISDLLLDRRKN